MYRSGFYFNHLLVMVACGFYLVVYILIHVAVIKFRIQYPDVNRDKKYILLNIPQIIGIVGMLYMEYTIFRDVTVLIIDLLICIIVLIYAVMWCKKGMKCAPFKANLNEQIEMRFDAVKEESSDVKEKEAPIIEKIYAPVKGQPVIITVSREFGSLGREIATKIAEKMNYHLYDPQIIEEVAKQMNADLDELLAYDDQKVINLKIYGSRYCSMAYPLGFGDTIKQRRVFELQKKLFWV